VQKLIIFLQKILSTKELKRKLIFTASIFLVYRLLAHIPVPSVDIDRLKYLFESNQFLNLVNVFSGGALANFSVVAVGISPYITASIIIQLAGMVIPKLKNLQKEEGEAGREKINQYTRFLSVPLAVAQSISVLALLRSTQYLGNPTPIALIAMIMSLVAGSMIMLWLGELISIYGIGNGVSIILFAGIVSQLPQSIQQIQLLVSTDQTMTVASFAVVFLAIIGLVVFMNEAVRKVSIQYAKRVRGSKIYGGQTTHLPIRVNVAGVMPIIFAVSIMLAPSFLARIFLASSNQQLIEAGRFLTVHFQQTSPLYMIIYFLIVFFFTFFSALLFFDAENISSELKKSGAFIPGIRPGGPTKSYLEFVVSRITMAGALFLSFIALFPSLAQVFTGVTTLAVSGTSVLIVVSVILETAKQAESMMVQDNYEKFL
jgi:preprotein translocase subunit SecY